MKNTPKKAIIIGASSGIGKALARELIQNNYRVGVTGRRKEQLVALQKEHPKEIYIKAFDCKQEDALDHIEALTDSLGGVDLFIISAGVGHINPDFDFNLEDQTNQLNVIAFTRLVNWSMHYFRTKGHGHLVNISSVASLRGGRHGPAYGASKAYQSNYIEGMAQKAIHTVNYLFIPQTFVLVLLKQPWLKGLKCFGCPVKKRQQSKFTGVFRRKNELYTSRVAGY